MHYFLHIMNGLIKAFLETFYKKKKKLVYYLFTYIMFLRKTIKYR